MVIKCPICGSNLTRGKTISYQDLARITIKKHKCKNPDCDADVITNADTEKIISYKSKFGSFP